MLIDLIAEADQFILIHKPVKLTTHGGADSLTQSVRAQFNDTQLYPCHRLDASTSGLVIFAKGKSANSKISQLFEQKMISKIYLAIGTAKPKKKQGLIKGDMKPARNGCWMLARTSANPAITQFSSTSLGEGRRLYILKPHTGKTHQLRVMMRSISAPILGDDRYGGEPADRCYLHAYSLAFTLDGHNYEFEQQPQEGEFFTRSDISAKIRKLSASTELNWPNIKT
ncbi:tRNA pseudouridine32 synthase / 23S rRNA pseudouridine746 synthase [Alteromonadaceae bacterium Bs31]|nr:tRNA pseudouridine32 synthase / 23S rRNA pseudouridine746 synthase [Alteromonadaceae bacterium Bs31]